MRTGVALLPAACDDDRMKRRESFARAEERAWRELLEEVARFTPGQLEEPGVTPEGWSVKDALFHIGCWLAECAHALERMRLGTFVEPEVDTDAVNREWFEASRKLDAATARAELIAGRNRMLQEWAALPEITPEAVEWFEESGDIHYAKHLGDLRAFRRRLSGA